jgi:hypothetical protein
MSVSRGHILIAMGTILALNVTLLLFGVYMGHEGLYETAAEMAKYSFSSVIGALAGAFSPRE